MTGGGAGPVSAHLPVRHVPVMLAQVMEDVKERSRYELVLLFGGHTAYDSLEQVVRAYEDRVG